MLVVGFATRITAAISSVLLVAFIIGIASAWARGLQIDCGCFGGGGVVEDATSKYPWEIARDVGSAAAVRGLGALAAYCLERRQRLANRRGDDRMSKKNRQATKRVKEMQAAQRAKEQRRRNLIIGGDRDRGDRGGRRCRHPGPAEPQRQRCRRLRRPGHGRQRRRSAGTPSAPVQVVMYEDFQCPACKQMEELIGDTLTQERRRQDDLGRVPPGRLPRQASRRPTTRHAPWRRPPACSTRTVPTPTSPCMTCSSPISPTEGTAGLSDEELAGLAEQAGADKAAVEKCQDDGTFDGWAKAATDAWSKAGFTGTPTILVDGEQARVHQRHRTRADAAERDRRSSRQLTRSCTGGLVRSVRRSTDLAADRGVLSGRGETGNTGTSMSGASQ